MFIKTTKAGYTKNGTQIAAGYFLLVCQHDEHPRELRAIVRYVRMRQLGHFMMARLQLAGHVFSLSGEFGSDGLPFDITRAGDFAKEKPENTSWQPRLTREEADALWSMMVPVPQVLADAYWKDSTGHNSVGSTAPAFRNWARQNIGKLNRSGDRLATPEVQGGQEET